MAADSKQFKLTMATKASLTNSVKHSHTRDYNAKRFYKGAT
jgi:hypothetical protein